MHNKTLKLTLWPTFRFGVPSALYPKTPLRPKCNLAKRYEKMMKYLIIFTLFYVSGSFACEEEDVGIDNYITSAYVGVKENGYENYTVAFRRLLQNPNNLYLSYVLFVVVDAGGEIISSNSLSFNDIGHNESVTSFSLAGKYSKNSYLYVGFDYKNRVKFRDNGSYSVTRLACNREQKIRLENLGQYAISKKGS